MSKFTHHVARLFLAVSMLCVQGNAAASADIFSLVRSGDLAALTTLIERGGDVNARNAAGQTPLMSAARESNNPKLIEQLINQGADVAARDHSGMTALMHAAVTGRLQNAEYLVEKGVDPGLKDNNGKTVIDHARKGGLHRETKSEYSFVSLLLGENHRSEGTTAPTYYITTKPGTISPEAFQQAAVRALTRKNWSVVELNQKTVRGSYARVKKGQLFLVDMTQEPARIAIRYRAGYGTDSEQSYLESLRISLMHELALF